MTRVKICGITNLGDAQLAVEAGADLLGFIFYKSSPRYVEPVTVREIVAQVKIASSKVANSKSQVADAEQRGLLCVGVFVNESIEKINQTLNFCRLDAVQLHGEEPPEVVQYFNGRAYKAMRPQSIQEGEQLIQRYQTAISHPRTSAPLLPCFLLDAYHPKLYGGTGRVTDWTMAAIIAERYPIMLAGSLTPENAAEAIRAVRPWGVDVSSGVEAEKGKKDQEKVRRFIKSVKAEAKNKISP